LKIKSTIDVQLWW